MQIWERATKRCQNRSSQREPDSLENARISPFLGEDAVARVAQAGDNLAPRVGRSGIDDGLEVGRRRAVDARGKVVDELSQGRQPRRGACRTIQVSESEAFRVSAQPLTILQRRAELDARLVVVPLGNGPLVRLFAAATEETPQPGADSLLGRLERVARQCLSRDRFLRGRKSSALDTVVTAIRQALT